LFWAHSLFPWLGRVPGTMGALAFVLPLCVWVSRGIYRTPATSAICLPYLLWLAAAATFLPQVSNDYNLVFLPLAALMTWDRRDPIWIHGCLAFLLLWWQPLALPVGTNMLLAFKFAGLVAVGACVVNRAREQCQTVRLAQPTPTERSSAIAA